MNSLLDIYCALERGDINEEEAASALGFTVHDFRFRKSRWKNRLPLLLGVLDKIQDGKITRNEASVALGITNRQVNHLMQTWRVQRPIANYFFEHVAAQIKWEIRKKYAIEFVAGTCTVEEAAENAQVSARQMRRWVSELLQKHFGMVWKDLRTLSDSKRRRLADEIETAEGLELAKQNVIRSITVGETTLNDVAAEIATHKRKKPHVRRIKTPKPKL